MARVEFSFAKLAVARAHFKAMEEDGLKKASMARLQLAILDALENAGGQMTALDLMTKVLEITENKQLTPFEMCSWIGKKPEDMVELG